MQINVLAASEANIYMFLFALFQVAAVSGNKGLAELITNFTDKDIGKLGRFFSLSLSLTDTLAELFVLDKMRNLL